MSIWYRLSFIPIKTTINKFNFINHKFGWTFTILSTSFFLTLIPVLSLKYLLWNILSQGINFHAKIWVLALLSHYDPKRSIDNKVYRATNSTLVYEYLGGVLKFSPFMIESKLYIFLHDGNSFAMKSLVLKWFP